MKRRASGILLHITSLASEYGVGDLGPGAYRFADFLAAGSQSYWQVLPLTPPISNQCQSPYTGLSAFAGNTLLISPEILHEQGLITRAELEDKPGFPQGKVDFPLAQKYKDRLLDTAFERFKERPEEADFEKFCVDNKWWLDDFAMFIALRGHFEGKIWNQWPEDARDRKPDAMKFYYGKLEWKISREKFIQYEFFRQWNALKEYCNDAGIQIFGDIPIYVAYDSADVWAHREIFKLDQSGSPTVVAGVPPDLFSDTGQLWGNPIYDWDKLKEMHYDWWIRRIKHNLMLFNLVRIDHFRGFIGYWEVPAQAETAASGKWVEGPREDFFNELFKHNPFPPIIVEDLGYITPDVREFIEKFQLGSMKVLLFAFDGSWRKNPYCPYNHVENCVVYTGTHDNNTVRGWLEEAPSEQKRNLYDYLGRKITKSNAHWELIRLAMSSVGKVVIIPMQDVLGLGAEARMNKPATLEGNWSWRMAGAQLDDAPVEKLAHLTQIYGRD